ncbi:MAG TPA: ATP-binding cassette domain-containing protein [Chthonomonadales bacterium]|nr:ATP-binding cassette domain-containing protein [Chthonomonadales bacterium]
MIELVGVSMRYGEVAALQPTDLTIENGAATVLIGPSGCGKSTLLRLIVGLLKPTTGRILLDGEELTDRNLLSVRRGMGYVIQDGGLFPHLTAGENALLLADHLKKDRSETRKRLTELCELTRFPVSGLSRYPLELSGGQRQRVSLMRALMLRPSVLLLDEPLAALDPLVRSALQTDLKTIFKELDQTILLVTHDMAEAAYLGDRIVVMTEGRVVQSGTLQDLRSRPSEDFVTEFMNAQRSLVQI